MPRTALRGLSAIPLLAILIAAGCTPKAPPAGEPDKTREPAKEPKVQDNEPKEAVKNKEPISVAQILKEMAVAESKQGQRPMDRFPGLPAKTVSEVQTVLVEPPSPTTIALIGGSAFVPVAIKWGGDIDLTKIDIGPPPSPATIALVGGSAFVPLTHKWGWDSDLTNLDIGLDSDLKSAVEVDRVADVNVEAVPIGVEAIGLPDYDSVSGPGLQALGGGLALHGRRDRGLLMMGTGTGGSPLAMPCMAGRTGAIKEKLLRVNGGNDKTEAAVARALAWLAKQQNLTGGFWEFDGSQKTDRVAATGMCLLPFLAAGETHKSGTRYKETVTRGLNYLKAQIKPNGMFSANMYSQAIATMAFCEAYGMTRDQALKRMAGMAVDYIVQAQAANGSWGYTARTEGDSCISSWQIQALKSARLAEIAVPQKAFDQAGAFLDSVSGDDGATYGYRTKGCTPTLTASGLLSRCYMGWTPRNANLQKGIAYLAEAKNLPTDANFNIYYYYYGAQIMNVVDAEAWRGDWNPKLRALLLGKQVSEKTPDAKPGDIGSFPKDSGYIGSCCGKLGTTVLACLTLEVYYRHLPLYKRDNLAPADDKK